MKRCGTVSAYAYCFCGVVRVQYASGQNIDGYTEKVSPVLENTLIKKQISLKRHPSTFGGRFYSFIIWAYKIQ